MIPDCIADPLCIEMCIEVDSNLKPRILTRIERDNGGDVPPKGAKVSLSKILEHE